MQDKRFIEETFPVKEVSAEASREKNIRHGHISTLHIWWARRPLAASRTTAYAALTPEPKDIDEWSRKRDFIINLSKWENSLNPHWIEKARQDILEANGGVPPKVLDPFGGGGAIPLEALRLGCETYSNDLNPVAVLIQKCTLEYPQKYGRPTETPAEGTLFENTVTNPLLEDVKKWGAWVLAEAKKELERFYPQDDDGSIPVGYIWARTIPCQHPTCGAEIPLMRQFWMAKKRRKKVALYPYVENGAVNFKLVGDGYESMPSDFDPTKGTVSRAVAVCPVCGTPIEAKLTRQLFQDGKAGQRMVAVVTHKQGTTGKQYRVATDADLAVFEAAEAYLAEKREQLTLEWGMDAVPDEPLRRVPLTFGVINVWVYGMNTWGDLFNAQQKLALITFVEKVKTVYQRMTTEGVDEEYAKVVVSYLALGIDRLTTLGCVLTRWEPVGEIPANVFGRQALPMLWDYVSINPFSGLSGGWQSAMDWIGRAIDHCSRTFHKPAIIKQSSATNLDYADNSFDAVLTDPPYYDSIPYSYLSDFFYVWLKRSIGDLYPDFFSTPLSPKKNEVVAYSDVPKAFKDSTHFFEEMLKQSFQEIQRVLKLNGIAVIVYAHKSTAGWETLINSLLDSDLVITSAWPIYTERQVRPRSYESATLTSSIYIVARKLVRASTGFYNEVKDELKVHLDKKLHRLWEEGLSGADFFIAAIGSAVEVFGKYKQVMNYDGEIIRADRLLEDVREIATDYAVRQILKNGFAGEISDLTRFYVLWRWEFGEARVPFDAARKLAQTCGIDLAHEWDRKGFIVKEKQFIRVIGPQARELDDLENASELIDVLHHVLLLWQKGNRDEMLHVLAESGLGVGEAFYRVAQAVSETLPLESKEKQLLDGFLIGRERVMDEMGQRRFL